MQSPKKETQSKPEKREVALVKEKPEETGATVRCINCGKVIAQGEVEMGKVVIKCKCGVKNAVDHQTAGTGRGRWIS